MKYVISALMTLCIGSVHADNTPTAYAHLATLRLFIDNAGNGEQSQRLQKKRDELIHDWIVLQQASAQIAKVPVDTQQKMRKWVADDKAKVAQACGESASKTNAIFGCIMRNASTTRQHGTDLLPMPNDKE